MPIKKLAQLILAVEGFLLLTAIVVSTSYQLSRKGVTETRSRAAVSQPRCDTFRLTLPAGKTSVLKTDPISIDINAAAANVGPAVFASQRPIVLSAYRVRDGASHDFLDYGGEPSHCEGKPNCAKNDRGFTFEHAGITEAGEYKIYPYMTNSEGGTCTDKPGTPAANQCGCQPVAVTLVAQPAASPKCEGGGLAVNKTQAGPTDAVGVGITGAKSGTSNFRAMEAITLVALRVSDNSTHGILAFDHCNGVDARTTACAESGRGFTPTSAGIPQAGPYKLYVFMVNQGGQRCDDHPSTPLVNQCGCGVKDLTVTGAGAEAPWGYLTRRGVAGSMLQLKVEANVDPQGGTFLRQVAVWVTSLGNFLHEIFVANPVVNNTVAFIQNFDWETGNYPAGSYTVWMKAADNSTPQKGCRADGDSGAVRCNRKDSSKADFLNVTLPLSSGPSCTSLTLNPSSPATRESSISATIKVSSGSSPFATDKVALHAVLSPNPQVGLGRLSTCPAAGCSFEAFTARTKELKEGTYQVWVSLENTAGLKCTDKPASLRQPTDPPACGCGTKNLVVPAAPAEQVGCGSFKVIKNDAELTDPVKIRSGEALILKAVPTFPTGVTMQGAVFASIAKSLDISTLRVIGAFLGNPPSGIPFVSWTVGDMALGEYYLFAVPGGLKGSTPMACSPFQLPFDLSGLQGMDPIDLRSIAQCPNCKKLVEVVSTPPPAREVTLKLRDEGNRVFPASGFVCGTSAANNTQPLEFNLVATYPVDPADKLKNGVDRVELRYRMQGTSTWKGIGFHQCTKVWDNTKKTLVGPAECKLYNMDWWRWLPREFYQGENLYEFKASAYSPNVGLYKETTVSGVSCTGPGAQPHPPATVKDPECTAFSLSATHVIVNTPVRVKVRAQCAGGACTDLAGEGIKDFNFFQKKGDGNWLWAGSKSCALSWPLHKVCFTGATAASCKSSDAECNAGTFNWVPTAAGTYQLQAKVSNNAGRQVMCGPKTVTATAAGGAALPQSWWQKLVAAVQGWIKALVPPALAQEATAPLKVIFKLDDAPQSLLGRVVTVGLLNLEEGYNLVAVPRGEGTYEATINLPASAAGPARIGVKPAGYLQRVKEATLVGGQTTTVDFGQTKFLGGDLNDDNKLTIADLAEELLPQFSETNELSVQLNDDNRFMDLNDDGIINVLDISIVLKNLTELEVRGEE